MLLARHRAAGRQGAGSRPAAAAARVLQMQAQQPGGPTGRTLSGVGWNRPARMSGGRRWCTRDGGDREGTALHERRRGAARTFRPGSGAQSAITFPTIWGHVVLGDRGLALAETYARAASPRDRQAAGPQQRHSYVQRYTAPAGARHGAPGRRAAAARARAGQGCCDRASGETLCVVDHRCLPAIM